MTTDLDPFFEALRHDADALSSGEPQTARRLGRRRSLRTVAGAAVGVLVLVGGITVAVRGGGGDREEVPHPATSTTVPGRVVAFDKMVPVGKPVTLPAGGTSRLGTVATVGDRAFVARQAEKGELDITAVDLITGKAAWGPKKVATFDDAAYVVWHPRYVLVLGRQDNGTRPDGAVIVLDQRTGNELMRLDVDNFERDHVLISESRLFVDSRADKLLRAYDLGTGQVRWSVPDLPSATVHVSPMLTAGASELAGHRSQLDTASVYTFTQLVQLTADGTAIVRDAATGTELSRHAKAASVAGTDDQHDDVLAIDGVLYTATLSAPSLLRATDLLVGGATRSLYAGEAGAGIHALTPCGAGRLCFTEYRENPASHQIVSLDTATGKPAWRHDYDPHDLRVVGGMVLTGTYAGRDDGSSALFDSAGRQLLTDLGSKGMASWLDTNALLIFRPAGDSSREVLGLSPVTGQPTPLGTVDAAGCGWSTTHLICVTPEGIKVWRFAH